MTAVPGLRERKKRRTREAIVREALALFAERGYDATTIADIAAAADIAPRTFFAYFPSKEAVVFHEFDDVYERFAERLRERPAGETAFDALRSWVVDWLDSVDLPARDHQAQRELIRTTPALQVRERSNMAAFEQLIAEGVAADLDMPADGLHPRMVSAAAVAALGALAEYEADPIHDPAEAVATMDEALSFLHGGLEALRRAARR